MRIRSGVLAIVLLIPTAALAQRGGGRGAGGAAPLAATATDPLAALRFRSIGPAFTSGRLADMAVDPKNAHIWYVATAAGGVWKTTNAGLNFTAIFDNYGSYSTCCILVDPRNSQIIWLATGENTNLRSAMAGDGIYKSSDGGNSWQRVGLERSEKIGRIAIDPRNPDVVYVAAQGPLWAAGGERGLYKTTDGGRSWTRILHISEETGITDVVLDPRNPDVIYTAAYQRRRNVGVLIGGGPEAGIFKSTNAGTTFTKLTNGLPTVDIGRIGLALSPQNPDVIYAIVTAQGDNSGFFRSSNGGATWVKQSDWASNDPQYYGEIAVDPHHFDRLCAVDMGVECSSDGGRTFQRQSWNVHTDHHHVSFDPADSLHMFNGNDGGLYETYDGGATWKHFQNLPITQFYRIAADNAVPFYNVYGGTQDNGSPGTPSRSQSPTGIRSSEHVSVGGGDGFQARVDPTDPNIIYSSSQNGAFTRMDKRTGASQSVSPPRADAAGARTRTAFEVPFFISPHNHNRVYAAANVLFRSENRGDTWTAISGDLTRQINRDTLTIMGRKWGPDAVARNLYTNDLGVTTALDESPLKEGLLYVGTDDGLVQVSEDGAKTWRKIESFPGVPPMTFVSELLPSRHDTSVVYASFNNMLRGDFAPYLLKSNDRGRTWTSIRANLPDRDQIWTIAEDHVNRNVLFIGTEHGVFATVDGGRAWRQLKAGLPTIAVRDIEIQRRESDLVLGTFGRGIYVMDDYSPLRLLATQGTTALPESALAAPRATRVYLETLYQRAGAGSELFTGQNPPFGALLSYTLSGAMPAGSEAVLTIANAAGREIAQVTGPGGAGLNRAVWNLRESAPAATGGRGAAADSVPPAGGGRGGGRAGGGGPGPLVAPGNYTVRLNRRTGTTLTPLGAAQQLQIIPLEASR